MKFINIFIKIKNYINKNKLFVFFLLVILLLILFYISYKNKSIFIEKYENNNYNEFLEFINKHTFYDENDNLIDHKKEEIDEQYQVYQFIESKDIVLELGGRYGSVSTVINKMVHHKNNHVVVEPDNNVIHSLEKNKSINNCKFTICPKFISNKNKKIVYDGYGTRVEDSNETSNNHQLTYQEFKKLYPQRFNVLVADCEGCLEEFLEIMGDDFDYINKVIYEEDQPHMCNYDKIKEKLLNAGFVEKNKSFKDVNRYVYMKE
jgi:FkbM family methyltransferase